MFCIFNKNYELLESLFVLILADAIMYFLQLGIFIYNVDNIDPFQIMYMYDYNSNLVL